MIDSSKPHLMIIFLLSWVTAACYYVGAESSSFETQKRRRGGSSTDIASSSIIAPNPTERDLAWNGSSSDAATECSELLMAADDNQDGVVEWNEYPFLVQQLSVDTEYYQRAMNVSTYIALPIQLKMTYNRLACYFCFNNRTGDDGVMEDMFPVEKQSLEACCIGLETMYVNSTDAPNDVLGEEEIEYLLQICEMTFMAMEEAWPVRDDNITEGLLETCPEDLNPRGDCTAYVEDLQCEYNHIYLGCTWEELMCQYIERCDCFAGEWFCLSLAVAPCGFDGTPVPEGLPWGSSCDPSAPLPRPPAQVMSVNDDELGS